MAQEFAATHPYVKLLVVDTRGKGLAVKAWMLAAQGDYRFICDTDLSMPIEEIVKFLPPQVEGYDVIIATREGPLARRVGWRAEALNLPGHVIVEVKGGVDSALIDPFDHGHGISRERAVEIARHGGGEPVNARFEPMTNRQLLIRLITNQASRARSSGDSKRALKLYDRMTRIAPRLSSLWWERARLEQLLGQNVAARGSIASSRSANSCKASIRSPSAPSHCCTTIRSRRSAAGSIAV